MFCTKCGSPLVDSDIFCTKCGNRVGYAAESAAQFTNEEIMKIVKPAICAQLKSPASAQFPDEMLSIIGDCTQGYHISGYVDSQNSFGALIRNDFTAEVVVENGLPVLKRASVGVQANRARAKEFTANYIAISIFTIIVGALLYFIISSLVGL